MGSEKTLKKQFWAFLPIVFLILFSATQFFLILRHKSPYLSDSYFYLHKYYQLQGSTFDQAYEKVKSQVPLESSDKIIKNIFTNKNSYKHSYTFFSKRPLYPLTAFILNLFVRNQFFSFLIPIFLAYIGLILVAFLLFRLKLSPFLAVFATALFVSFYPFLDYSTYFLTDTLGSFFWFMLLALVFKFLSSKNKKWPVLYSVVFLISLTNRETAILFIPLLGFMYMFGLKFKFLKDKGKILYLLVATCSLTLLYFLFSYLLGLPTLLDTVSYTHNSYGLYNKIYPFSDTIKYMGSSVINSHKAMIIDLTQHHWWFVFSLLSLFGVIKTFFFTKEKNLIELLIFFSLFSSYLFTFVFPDFSYRYYYPVVIGICYFSTKFLRDFFAIIEGKT